MIALYLMVLTCNKDVKLPLLSSIPLSIIKVIRLIHMYTQRISNLH